MYYAVILFFIKFFNICKLDTLNADEKTKILKGGVLQKASVNTII